MRLKTAVPIALALLLPFLSAFPPESGAVSERQLMQYRTLQSNVDQAFLWTYLNQNAGHVGPASGKIRYIGYKIIQATGDPFFFNCHFYLVRSKLANAVTSPKGSIFLYGGLDRLKLTEAEKAALIAHEVGHLARSHWLLRLQRGVQSAVVARYAARTYGRNSAQISRLYAMIRNLRYDRAEEYEADAIGVQLLLNAGYPPRAMVTLLQKLDADQKAHAGSAVNVAPYLSDHPLTPDRITRLERLIPLLKPQQRHLRRWS